jgi:hypothetical protein
MTHAMEEKIKMIDEYIEQGSRIISDNDAKVSKIGLSELRQPSSKMWNSPPAKTL